MSKRGRTTKRSASGTRNGDLALLLLPDQLEMELVGIIGPGDGTPGSALADTILLDGEEGLLDLVESLRGDLFGAAPKDSCFAPGAQAAWDECLH